VKSRTSWRRTLLFDWFFQHSIQCVCFSLRISNSISQPNISFYFYFIMPFMYVYTVVVKVLNNYMILKQILKTLDLWSSP